MELYIDVINNAVDYIEDNILEKFSLSDISGHFYLSEYHFDRLFKVFTGRSLKQYILGRKMAAALIRLNSTNDSIINIAMDLGFEYPEVFSRAFKNHFGISPSAYRIKKPEVSTIDKAMIVSRNLVNFQGALTLKASYLFLESLHLQGFSIDVDIEDPLYGIVLRKASDKFLYESQDCPHLNHDKLYSLVNCHGDDSSMYTVFSGKEVSHDIKDDSYGCRTIPDGWYACFTYKGDIIDIRSTFVDDLFKWIALKEIELVSNGIGMISIFDKDYIKNQNVRILIPIALPKA